MTGIEKKFFDLANEVVSGCGYILYDAQYISGSKTLRVFIMDPETKTAVIEDCVKVDHGFSQPMEQDWIPDDIVLEVSSPGMYRHLSNLEHFKMAVEEMIVVKLDKKLGELFPEAQLAKKVANEKKIYGKLLEVDPDFIVMNLDDEFDLKISFQNIKKANLEPAL